MPTKSQAREKAFSVEAFLKQMAPKEEIDFFGVTIPVPTDAPLSFTLKQQEIAKSDAEDTNNVLKLLADILGQDKADEIEAADPGIRAIGALLLWAFKNSSGEETPFPEAYEQYVEQEKEGREKQQASAEGEGGDDEGKQVPANREERRAAQRSGTKSASTSRS